MACTYNGRILKSEDINAINKEHEDFFIEGLDFNDQRTVVKSMAYALYEETMTTGKAASFADLRQKIIQYIERETIANQEFIEMEKMISGEDMNDTIANTMAIMSKHQAIIKNMDKLALHAKDMLASLSGSVITKNLNEAILENEEADPDIAEEEPDGAGIERTTFSENFYFELDSRKTMSNDLKKFLSFIPNVEYTETGNKQGVPTIIGTTDFMEFDYVFDQLHRLLVGTYPSTEAVRNKLIQEKDASVESKNSNTIWLEKFIDMYDKQPDHVKREFNSEMAKHKIEMQFVNITKRWDAKAKKFVYTLRLYSDNSNDVSIRLRQIWKKNFAQSEVIQGDEFNQDVINDLLDTLEKIRTIESDTSLTPKEHGQERINGIINILNTLGIDVNHLYIQEFFNNGDSIKVNGKDVNVYGFLADKGPIHMMLLSMLNHEEKGKIIKPSPEDYDITSEAVVKALALGSAKYEVTEFNSSFRVGGKVIYTYSMNQYMINRFKDLLQDPILRSQLSETMFAKDSLYLDLLQDENSDLNFKDSFNVSYVSLQPLKVVQGEDKSTRSDKITEVSELDYETAKTGYFNSTRKYITQKHSFGDFKVRVAQFFFPTISDKSRAMNVTGVAYEVTERFRNPHADGTFGISTRFTDASIQLFYEKVVKPEVERIHKSVSEEFNEDLNLKAYNGQLFYLIPSLNDLRVPNPDQTKGGDVLLLDIVKANGTLTGPALVAVYDEIRKTLTAETNKKLETWDKLGIRTKEKKLDFISAIPNSAKSMDGSLEYKADKEHNQNRKADNKQYIKTATETAMDMVFNYAMFNANMFQLVIGDPAQYFKGSKTDIVAKDLESTYSNIIKRLAAEAAPGFEFDGSDYLQVYAEDVYKESESFAYLLNLLDGIKIEDFNKMSPKEQKKTIAYGYSNMESTNAQEYTTWKEHLGILRDLGRVTAEEYEEAYDALSKDQLPSKETFKKVFQPIKPVYAYNTVRKVGDTKVDVKTYIKSSSFPLIKQFTKGFQLDKLRIAMENLENDKKQNPEGLPVRVAFASGVKVGFPKDALKLTAEGDKTGNIVDDIDLTDKYVRLNRRGFRIQQDIPYDPTVREISKGTQEMKLLWANFLDPDLPAKEFERRQAMKNEYTALYQQLYLQGKKELESELKDKNGKVSNRRLAAKLIKKLRRDGEQSKSLLDGLKINPLTNDFEIPLWLSPYADKYMSLLNSLVKNSILSQKFPGKSFVLGSDLGIKGEKHVIKEGEEAQKEIDFNPNIIVTENYDPSKGLQIYVNEEGIMTAQVMIPFKFLDNDGNPLDLKNFIVPQNGRKFLDTSKLPPELLDSFGFRIPTQLECSMAKIEIVGFLPSLMGDLVLAPAEFTVQMGSDFDVDKLYMYMYATDYDKKTMRLQKISLMPNGAEVIARAEKEIQEAILKFQYTDIDIEDINSILENHIDEVGVLRSNVDAIRDKLNTLYKDNPKLPEITRYAKFYLDGKKTKLAYLSGIKNRLLDIHLEVMSETSKQSSIAFPLSTKGFGLHKEMIELLDTAEEGQETQSPIIFDEYHRKKFYDGTAGKAGVGMFSLDSVFNVLAQGKDLILEYDEYNRLTKSFNRVPVRVEFGTAYNVSTGELSKIRSQKKVNPRYKTEVVAASQNLSVDNANEQGMHRINMNQYTFSVYSVLSFLGFEEDISDLFMAQPIIRKYVNRMRNEQSILKKTDYNAERRIVEELIAEYYGGPLEGFEKADFHGEDASKKMLSLIKDGEKVKDYGEYQAAILNKFIYLKQIEKPIREVKSLLNIDSKGFSKSMHINKTRLRTLTDLTDTPIQNVHNLFGELQVIDDALEIIPNTTAGFDNVYGTKTLVNTFGNYFLEGKEAFHFRELVQELESMMGRNLYEEDIKKLREAYKNYMISNLHLDNVDELRKELFFNQGEDSFLDKLVRLKETPYGKKNKFLKSLNVNTKALKGNSEVRMNEISYNNSGGDNFDESAIYKSFVDMFREGDPKSGVIPAEIAEDLMLYSLLRGGNKAHQFLKFIPVLALKKILKVSTANMNPAIFLDQYLRHNHYLMPVIDEKDIESQTKQSLVTKDVQPEYIRLSGKGGSQLYRRDTNLGGNNYIRIDQLGIDNTTEYTPYAKGNSIFASNTVTKEVKPDLSNPLQHEYVPPSPDIQEDGKDTTDSIYDKLNTKSVTALLDSIAELQENYPDEAKLATVLKSSVAEDVKLVVTDTGNSSYNTTTKTITLSTDSTTNKDFLITALHEVLHSLTDAHLVAFEAGKTLPVQIGAAMFRLHGLKNKLVDKMLKTNKKELDFFFVNFVQQLIAADRKSFIENQILKRSLHPYIEALIRETLAYEDGKDSARIAAIDENPIDLSHEESKLLYSLVDLGEFIAVSGSYKEVRNAFNSLIGDEYKTLIGQLFKAILDYLGIKDLPSQQIMNDIFVVSGINPETIKPVQPPVTAKTINIFSSDKNGFEGLSNFNNGPIRVVKANGKQLTIRSVEHYYQIKKALFFNDNETANKIYAAKTGVEAKKLSKEIKGFDGKKWSKVSYSVMEEILRKAFTQNKESRDLLLKTGDAVLTHNSAYAPDMWTEKFPELLMKLREEFKKEGTKVSTAEDIYSKITKSKNVRIEQWDSLKDLKEPFLRAYNFISHVVATRIKNSDEHFGNPFSSDEKVLAKNPRLIKTATIKEAVVKYIDWVLNSTDTRAKWIRSKLVTGELKDKPVLYTNTSAQKAGEISHADALDYLINKYDWKGQQSDATDINAKLDEWKNLPGFDLSLSNIISKELHEKVISNFKDKYDLLKQEREKDQYTDYAVKYKSKKPSAKKAELVDMYEKWKTQRITTLENKLKDLIVAYIKENISNKSSQQQQGDETYTNHSGGAVGSDSEWDKIGREFGVTEHKHYYHGAKTPKGNVKITDEQLEEGWKHVLQANKTLNRKPGNYKSLLSRNWFQVKNAESIFAIGKFAADSNTVVDGGTGWAVQMAVDANKTVYLFNQTDNKWYVSQDGQPFELSDTPVLTKNFAGIGTRKITDKGKQAIRNVYEKTFNKQVKGTVVEGPVTTTYYLENGTFYKVDLNADKTLNKIQYKQSYNGEWKDVTKNPLKTVERLRAGGPRIQVITEKDTLIKKEEDKKEEPPTTGNKFTFPNGIVIDTGKVALTEKQKQALLKLADFLENPGVRTFSLMGYAGTGKTTIMKFFNDYLKQKKYTYGKNLIFTTPTNRANQVLSKSIQAPVMTLHKVFGLDAIKDEDVYDVKNLAFTKIKNPAIGNNGLVVIDESSMVSDKLYEMIQDAIRELGIKVIFVGDPLQLRPPGQDTDSKAFSATDVSIELTEVKRTEDSPLLDEITSIREGNNFSYNSSFSSDGGIVYVNNKTSFIQKAADLFNSKQFKTNPLFLRILAATNKAVDEMNMAIRKKLFPDADTVQYHVGEILVGKSTWRDDPDTGPTIINSADYRVTEVHDEIEVDIYGIPVKVINLILEDLYEPVAYKKRKGVRMLSTNNSKETFDALGEKFESIRQKAIYEQNKTVEEWMMEGKSAPSRKEIWKDYYEFRDSFASPVYIGVKDQSKIAPTLGYGYALTVDKAQGGTYDNIFVVGGSISSFQDEERRQQLKYVALSRASLFAAVLSAYGEQDTDIDDIIDTLYPEGIREDFNDNIRYDVSYPTVKEKLQAVDEFAELEELGKDLMEKCKGKFAKAEHGMRSRIQPGGRWKVIKDFKGEPSHEKGGVDIEVTDGKIRLIKGKNEVHAKYGMALPKIAAEKAPEVNPDREPLYSTSWSLIKDFKGLPSHKNGGVNLNITEEGNIHFSRNDSSIHAACGCMIPSRARIKAEEGLVIPQEVKKATIKRKKKVVPEVPEKVEVVDKPKKVFQKPKLNATFVTPKDLVNSKDPVASKIAQEKLKEKYDLLKELTEELYGTKKRNRRSSV